MTTRDNGMTAVVERWQAGPLGVTLHLSWGHADKPTGVVVWVPWDELSKITQRQGELFAEETG